MVKLCLRNAILIALFYVLNHDATRSVIDICGHLRVNTQNAFLIVTLTIHDDSWRFAQYNFSPYLTRENYFTATFSGYTGAIVVFDGLEALLKPENFFFLKPLYPSMLVLSKGTFDFVSF